MMLSLIKILFIFLFIVVLGFNMFGLYYDYDAVFSLTMKWLNLTGNENEIKEKYFSLSIWIAIRVALLVLLIISGGILLRINPIAVIIKRFLVFVFEKVKQLLITINDLPLLEKSIFFSVLFVLVVLRFYFAPYLPFMVDEAYSYLYFVSKGFLVTASYYPGPNNHILYLHFCGFLNLFMDNPIWIMKLPSLVFSVLTYILLFIFIKRNFNTWVAFYSSISFSLVSSIMTYSLLGRGYILLILLFLISIIAWKNMMLSKDYLHYRTLFVISCALGFYTIPVFLYPFVSMVVASLLLLPKSHYTLREFVIDNCLIVIVVSFFYLPVFIVSGVGSITDNGWVQPLLLKEWFFSFPGYLLNVIDGLIDFRLMGLLFLISITLAGGYSLYKKENKVWLYLFASLLITPLVVILIQRLLPYDRVWTFELIVFSVLFGMVLNQLLITISDKSRKQIAVSSLVIMMSFSIFFYYWQPARNGDLYYDELNEIISSLPVEKIASANVQEDTYHVFLKLLYQEKNMPLRINNSYDECPSCDLLILPVSEAFDSDHYSLYKRNSFVKVFLKK